MNKDIKTLVMELNDMNSQGKSLEAFEKYYDDDVVMQENNDEPRVSKKVNRERETSSANNLLRINEWKILNIAYGDDLAMMEIYEDVDNKDGTRFAGSQVVVQKWKDGKIIKERFYYDTK